MEMDIISPTADGRYRVNPDRRLAVVIAVQTDRLETLTASYSHGPSTPTTKPHDSGSLAS